MGAQSRPVGLRWDPPLSVPEMLASLSLPPDFRGAVSCRRTRELQPDPAWDLEEERDELWQEVEEPRACPLPTSPASRRAMRPGAMGVCCNSA